MPLEDTFEIEVFKKAVPPENTSRVVPLIKKIVLRVTRVGEVAAAVGPSGLTSPS